MIEENNLSETAARAEALLFINGAPMKISKLADIMEMNEEDVRSALDILKSHLENGASGLLLSFHDDSAQIVTKPETSPALEKLVLNEIESGLTPASLETLAVVAYLGPCTRSLIEHIRGVNSSFILRSLMIRGLIERKQNPRRALGYLYQVTFDFLNHIGISSIDELPEYEKYRSLIESFSAANESSEPQK